MHLTMAGEQNLSVMQAVNADYAGTNWSSFFDAQDSFHERSLIFTTLDDVLWIVINDKSCSAGGSGHMAVLMYLKEVKG